MEWRPTQTRRAVLLSGKSGTMLIPVRPRCAKSSTLPITSQPVDKSQHIIFIFAAVWLMTSVTAPPALAQPQSAVMHHHEEDPVSSWQLHYDGALFGTLNHQGGRRGGTEFDSQNWVMVMGDRPLGRSTFGFSTMFSAEPLTVRGAGYRENFQEGEAYHGLQITDRQHPHDLFMQLAAALRTPLGSDWAFTVAGSAVGDAALGPVAFMHRPSSAENPTAPLSHHIFDSTHIARSVVLTRLERGPITIEGSVFHGREPDENRYNLDFGQPDSWSVRAWARLGSSWTLQASHGFLRQPEQLEPGDQRRTNASAEWLRQRGGDYSALMIAVGRTQRPYSVVDAVLAEGTHRFGQNTVFGRFERTEVETEILLFPSILHKPHPGELVDPVRECTIGGIHDFATFGGLSLGAGGDVVLYGVPPLLQVTHGEHPTSFHIFVRVGPAGGHMWNMTMASASSLTHHHH